MLTKHFAIDIVEARCYVIHEQKSLLSNSRNIRTFQPVCLRQLTKTHGSKCPDLLFHIYVA